MLLTRIWHNASPFHVEFAEVSIERDAMQASGVAIGVEPVGYRLEYVLSTTPGYVTRRLEVTSRGARWRRGLMLERSASGVWSCSAEAHGDPQLQSAGPGLPDAGLDVPNPGGDLGAL